MPSLEVPGGNPSQRGTAMRGRGSDVSSPLNPPLASTECAAPTVAARLGSNRCSSHGMASDASRRPISTVTLSLLTEVQKVDHG
jgi:hypothetical protein